MTIEKYFKIENEIGIKINQTKIDGIKKKNISQTGIRVYKDNLIGIAGILGKFDEDYLIKKAEENLKYKISYPFPVSSKKTEKQDFRNIKMDEKEFLDNTENFLIELQNKFSNFSFSNKIKYVNIRKELSNTENLNLQYHDSYFALELLFRDIDSSNIIDGFVFSHSRELNYRKVVKKIEEIYSAFYNTIDLPPGNEFPVIFISSNDLPLKKLQSEMNGYLIGSGSSILSDKIGKKIFGENVTIYQNNDPKQGLICFFDAEGSVNENYMFNLIENGIFTAPFTDKKISKKYNLKLTGSAAGTYDSYPQIGVPDIKIKRSKNTLKEILNGEKGILVFISSGGDYTPDGNFASPVQLAFLTDGEKLTGRLPQIQISSNLFDMYGNAFRGASSDTLYPDSFVNYLTFNMKTSKL